MALVIWHVQDAAGKPIGGAQVSGASTEHGDWGPLPTNPCGDLRTELGPGVYKMTIARPGYQTRTDEATIKDCGVITYGLERGGVAGLTAQLAINKGVFCLDNGERFTAIECSDFNLFGRYLNEGALNITEVLGQRVDAGFNLLRVWTAYSGSPQFEHDIGHLDPSDWPRYYERLPEFLDLCSNWGLYVELTAFTGGPISGHWPNLGLAAHEARIRPLMELVNECDSHNPTIDPSVYRSLTGLLCSHGSNGSQKPTVRNPFSAPLQAGDSGWWNYETWHTNDASEWQRKVGHNAMEYSEGARYPNGTVSIPASHVPILTNENTRYTDRDGDPVHAYDAAAGAALLCAGSCYHSVSGKKSGLWLPDELNCARQWAEGAKSVPLEFQDGRYNRIDTLPEGVIRVYQRVLQDGRAHTVEIHA